MRWRRLIRTVPLTWWLAVVALATVTALVTTQALRGAEAAQARWGRATSVVVAVRPIAAGEAIDAANTEIRPLPAALVPLDALTEVPVGRAALIDLLPGEVIVAPRIAGPGRLGAAALLDVGERAVAITAPAGERPPVATGDLVDLVAVPADGGAASLLAPARVVDVDAETGAVTVAVAAGVMLRVALGMERGRVVLALRP